MNERKRQTIRHLVKIREDYQKLRIASDNRLGKKADGTDQDAVPDAYDNKDALDLVDIKEATRAIEQKLDRKIAKAIRNVPVYDRFLKDVKGIGPMMAAVLISEIDIEKASTVSKIWQYAGCCSAMVYGKKKKGNEIIITNDLVRGDKPTSGYLLPYNKFLKTKLLGVMADCFIKAKSPYTKYYYDYKNRLANSDKPVNGNPDKKWKDEPLIHRDRAARRYMVKHFLIDLYINWRTIEGLPVRDLYQEEYLNHQHHKD